MTVQIAVPKILLEWQKKPRRQCEFGKKKKNACSEKPRGSAIKRVKKFCEKKHLKHRCRADVSHNTSSSSDMLSCLSPIQMLMLNQAVQSRSISNHQVVVVFFFWFFFLQAINLPWREIKA